MNYFSAIPIPEQIVNADPVVKAILAILVLTSLVSWAIILEKLLSLAVLARAAAKFEAWSKGRGGPSLLGKTSSPAARVASACLATADEEDPKEARGDRRARIERVMRRTVATELTSAEWGLSSLAITGSVAPFIGLFGTVWGIMRSFSAIGRAQDVSLVVIAPGIAEALLATALGLVTAIPAVIAYNRFAARLARIAKRFTIAGAEVAERLACLPVDEAPGPQEERG